MAHVASIVYRPRDTGRPPDRFGRVPADRVTLAESQGIVGDSKGGSGGRQLNVMRADTVAELAAEGFKAEPGELGEQVVIAGLPADALAAGVRLRLGAAVIEVGIPRTGCARFEMIQGKARQDAAGRLGVLARVVTGGEVAVGDPVEVLPADPVSR